MENNSFVPKWVAVGLGVLLMLFVLLLIVQKGSDLKTSFANKKPANTISVSGEGKVTAVPNLATVTVGVMTQANTATDAKNQNNDKINKVTAFIKSQGIDAKDIKTENYNLNPSYDYTKGTPAITGYQITQNVSVKVHNVDKSADTLNKIMDGVVNNGANQVYGVNLTLENPSDLQQQARNAAIENAKQKAQELAKTAGLTLGKVISISEGNNPIVTPMPYALEARDQSMGSAVAKSIAPSIETGDQEISEIMTVTFEVK